MRKTVFRQALSVSGSNIASKALSFFSAALVARMLAPEGFGILDFAMAVCTHFFTLFMLNVPLSVSLALPKSRDRNAVFSSGALAVCGLLAAAAAVFLLFQGLFLRHFGENLLKISYLIVATGVGYGLWAALLAMSQGFEDFGFYNFCFFSQSASFLLLVLMDFFYGLPVGIRRNGATGAMLFYLLSYAPTLVLGVARFKKRFVWPRQAFLVGKLLSDSARHLALPGALATAVALLQRTVFFSQSPAGLGQYRVIDLLSVSLIVPISSLCVTLLPKMIRKNYSRPDVPAYKAILRRLLLLLCFSLVAMAYSGFSLIRIAFGAKYAEAALFFAFAAPGFLFVLLLGFMLTLTLSVGGLRGHYQPAQVIAYGSLVLISPPLIGQFGIWGMISANTAAYGLGVAYLALVFSRRWSLRLLESSAFCAFAIALMYFAGFLGGYGHQLLLAMPLALACLFLAARALGIARSDEMAFFAQALDFGRDSLRVSIASLAGFFKKGGR